MKKKEWYDFAQGNRIAAPKLCECDRPHYPLRYFKKDLFFCATRGTKPAEKLVNDGWTETTVAPFIAAKLHESYDKSHAFDWLHTPTYLDDMETHLRMKEETKR